MELATNPDGVAAVVFAMRADFYSHCLKYAELAAALSEHQILVGPMSKAELDAGHQAPGRVSRVRVRSSTLIERVLSEVDVEDQAGSLPLLEYASFHGLGAEDRPPVDDGGLRGRRRAQRCSQKSGEPRFGETER